MTASSSTEHLFLLSIAGCPVSRVDQVMDKITTIAQAQGFGDVIDLEPFDGWGEGRPADATYDGVQLVRRLMAARAVSISELQIALLVDDLLDDDEGAWLVSEAEAFAAARSAIEAGQQLDRISESGYYALRDLVCDSLEAHRARPGTQH